MPIDPRQIVAAFLTLYMFVMLGDMVKRDHFDSNEKAELPRSAVRTSIVEVKQQGTNVAAMVTGGPWMETNPQLKPCWEKPASREAEQFKGYVTFSLTTGPEYHLSQITDAVVVARYLGAALVLPDIRGSELGKKRNFGDIYDIEKFIKSLDGVVKLVRELPGEIAAGQPALVRVPNRISLDFMEKNIEPIFRTKNYLRLAIVFNSISLTRRETQSSDLDSTSCLAMFDSLELKPEVLRVADSMVSKLRTLSRKSDGKFIAVDLRSDVLEKKSCKEIGKDGMKGCYTVEEVTYFLKKVGFHRETSIYLTQTWWHDSLNLLKENFPKIYTKDDVIPANKKGKFFKSEEFARAFDFHICSKSDVFVPAISGLFYANVAAKRIASGRTQILIPSRSSSVSVADSISTYVAEKNHWAYSCYC